MRCRLILALAISGAASCSAVEHAETGGLTHRQLVALVQRGAGTEAPLDSIISGEWNALYVFGPYTPADVIHRCVGGRVESHGLDARDDINLVVLLRNGSRTSLTVPRTHADFAPEALRARFRPDDRWRVRQPPPGSWGNLEATSELTSRCS